MSIHIEAAKHGLFILHKTVGSKHYAVSARRHGSGRPEVCGVSDPCETAEKAKRQALEKGVQSLKSKAGPEADAAT